MTYTYRLEGKSVVELPPAVATLSGQYRPRADYLEQLLVKNRILNVVTLTSDVATVVSLGGLASACVVSLRVITEGAGLVLGTLVHANGPGEVVPIDPLHLTISRSSPVTGISLTRSPSVVTSVEVLLCELAP